MNDGRTGKTMVPGAVMGGGGLDQMLDAVVVGAPDPAASNSFLLVLSGTDPGRLHVLDRPEMVIGRSRFADIHISERALSQQHCKLTQYGDHHRLFDLGSTNGTFVNDMKVQQADLKPGDVIRTGETVFTYMSGSQTTQPMVGEQTMALPHHPMPGAPPAQSQALVRQRPAPIAPPSTALARRAPQPLITVAEGGYAGAPQMLEVPMPQAAPAAEGADLVDRILWVLGFLRRYWLSILLCTLLGAAGGVVSYKLRKPPARAEFEISLVPEASDNPAERMRRNNFEFFREAQKHFTRAGLIHETLKQLGETNVSAGLIRAKQASIEFTKAGEYTYKGAFSAPTADEAIKFLDVHLELYRESEIDKALKILIAEVETLDSQLAQAEEKLNSTNQAILAFKQEHSEGLPEKSTFILQRVLELTVARSQAQGEVTRTSADARVARKLLKSEDPLLQTRLAESAPYAESIADVNRRLAEARAQGKGGEHPDIKRMEEEKRGLEAMRDKVLLKGTSKVYSTKNPAYQAARAQVAAAEAALQVAQAELSRVNKELEEMEGNVDKLPQLQADYTELTRNQQVVQKTYDDLFQQLNGTRIRLALERSQAAARYDIITPPNVVPVSRVKTLIIRGGIGTFMGLCLGLGLGILREGRRYLAARLAAARR